MKDTNWREQGRQVGTQMGDEENRMPKNARREKNSKKESERERERKKRETERERERESAPRERTEIQYGDTRRPVALYQKVPATYIYIVVYIYDKQYDYYVTILYTCNY
jgi:FtsZ-interacting cell division protein YlmF